MFVVARAICTDAAALRMWLDGYLMLYPQQGYGTCSEGIIETPIGFVVAVRRLESCEGPMEILDAYYAHRCDPEPRQ